MNISRLCIKNYRNIRDIDLQLGDIVAIIGENNSGKSNLLHAITMPFLADDVGYMGKTLSWADINNEAKKTYYNFLLNNKVAIKNDVLPLEDFAEALPMVSVEVTLKPNETELYFVKDLSYATDKDGNILYGIRYEYKANNAKQIFGLVKSILVSEDITIQSIESMKMNLLPADLYSYSITVPQKSSIPYDILKQFRYTALLAERDDFSNTNEKFELLPIVKTRNDL